MIYRVILYVEILDPEFSAEALGVHQRREAGKRPSLGLAVDRQQLAIAPEIVRARLDQPPRDMRADTRVVVGHLERTEARLAYVQRADRVLLAAFAAFQIGDVGHLSSSCRRACA